MLDIEFETESKPNQWRYITNWTTAGIGPVSIDCRLALAWLFVLPFSGMIYIALPMTIYTVIAKLLRVPGARMGRLLKNRLRGRRIGGLSMRRRTGLLPVIFLVFSGALFEVDTATAEFRVIVPEKTEVDVSKGGIKTPINLDDVVESYGHDITLKDAATMLLPGDWTVKFDDGKVGKREVHWRSSDKTVRQVLTYISDQANAQFKIDEEAGVVTFAALPNGMRMTDEGVVRDTRVDKYVLRSGHMLSKELARWAKEAGFQFHWGLETDYPITVDAEFVGYLPKVLLEVFETYRSQGGLRYARYIPGSQNNVLAFMPLHD